MRLCTTIGISALNVALALAPGALMAQTPAPAAKGAVPTTFVVRFKIKPGRSTDFERIMAKVQAALPSSEPGNLYYDLYVPAPHSQTYVLIEHYKDAAAVTAHGQDKAVQAMAAALKDVLDGPMNEAVQAEQLILVSSKPSAP